jgi:hypothetical protein
MANATPQMLTDFPAWYATVSVGQPDAAVARWPAVLEAAKATTRADIEVFVRIAFKTKQAPSAEGTEKFTKAIRSTDNTFDAVTAAREMQVLAASVLMHLCPINVYAALAVTTAALDGGRKPNLPMDLVGAGEGAIRAIAESSRRRTNLGELTAPDVKWGLTAEETAQNTKQPKDMVEDLRAVVQQAFKVAAERENRILAAHRQQMRYSDEELQMLWWLTGGQTTEGTPFEKIETSARPFVLGRELADRTATLPGPGSIRALLSRAGLKAAGQTTIPQVVNAMKDSWSKSAIGERSVSPVTLPLHNALHRRNETGAGKNWIKNWASVTEIAEAYAATPLRLAELFYRERLLFMTQN